MVEPDAPERDHCPTCHQDVLRQAFLVLKRYDRNVARSDPFLCRVEDAWRTKDTEALVTLLTAALAERVVGH